MKQWGGHEQEGWGKGKEKYVKSFLLKPHVS